MRKTTMLIISFFGISSHSVAGQTAASETETARVQFIHTAADAALSAVDIYINGKLVADNMHFRTATSFFNAPAGVPLLIDFANASSTAATQRFYGLNTTFTAGVSHVVIAEGVESTISLRPGHPFTLFQYSFPREEALISTNTDIFVHHGFDQSPIIDIVVPAMSGEMVNQDAFYRAGASGFVEAPAIDHTVKVHQQADALIASYVAPLQTMGLQGHVVVLLGSGFVRQLPDQNDPEYGLYIAVPEGGNLIPLPLIPGNVFSFAEANIVMHPNPATQFLRFEFPFAVRNISAQIVDNSGATVRVAEDFGNRIDVADLPEGIYTINLRVDEKLFTDKFVKGL